MRYVMNQEQSKVVYDHFQYLIGEPWYHTDLKIEIIRVFKNSLTNEYEIYLCVNLANKQGYDLGDTELITNLWHYLTQMNIPFDPVSIGLNLPTIET